jgi:hypothetical protein
MDNHLCPKSEKQLFDLFDINEITVQELFPGLNDNTYKDVLSYDISNLFLKHEIYHIIKSIIKSN